MTRHQPRLGPSAAALPSAAAALLLLPLGACGSEASLTRDPRPRTPEGERASALAASVSPARAPEPAGERPVGEPYRIGFRDRLEISVLGQPDWRQELPVRPDGKFSYMLVGDVQAAGRTVEEVREELRGSLARYLKRPEVSVAVRDFASRVPHVYVAGEVREPGAYPLTPPHDTFLDAVFAAGGATLEADLSLAYVARGGEILAADFDRLVHEGNRGGNFMMRDGDFVYFPKKDFLFVYVIGQVRQPRAVPATRPIKLLDAVAQAGGLAQTAFHPDVKVIRGGLRDPKVESVDFVALSEGDLALNLTLEPGDIVFAPRHPLTAWNDLVTELVPSLSAVVLTNVLRTQSTR